MIGMAGIVALAILSSSSWAQTCNPVIDGTYCADLPPRSSATPRQSAVTMTPINNLAKDLFQNQDQPATVGSFSVLGGSRQCLGLLRRGACN
jgi:hypothetical protein